MKSEKVSGYKRRTAYRNSRIRYKIESNKRKNCILNKLVEIIINLKSEYPKSRKLAWYNFSKMNITESTSLENLNKEIVVLKEELDYYFNEYEGLTRCL